MIDNEKRIGRVLRLKMGYNPNSSSLGSDIPAFLACAGAGAALVTVLMHLLGDAGSYIRRGKIKPTEMDSDE